MTAREWLDENAPDLSVSVTRELAAPRTDTGESARNQPQEPQTMGTSQDGSGERVLSLDVFVDSGVDLSESLTDMRSRGVWKRVSARRAQPTGSDSRLEAALRPFLDDLTIPQRDALRLVYWERMTLRDAAERLGIHLKTLQGRLEGAQKALRKAFEADSLGTTYDDVRQGLQPGHDVAGFSEARCVNGGEVLAQYRSNALGLVPTLSCGAHR